MNPKSQHVFSVREPRPGELGGWIEGSTDAEHDGELLGDAPHNCRIKLTDHLTHC